MPALRILTIDIHGYTLWAVVHDGGDVQPIVEHLCELSYQEGFRRGRAYVPFGPGDTEGSYVIVKDKGGSS